MLVYRIQTKNNYGPYSLKHEYYYPLTDAYKDYNNGQSSGGNHKTPVEDGLEYSDFRDSLCTMFPKKNSCDIRNALIFGFETLDSLEKWFPQPLRKEMENICSGPNYYTVNVYNVDEQYVKVGKSQVIFYKSKARYVRKLSLVSLEKVPQEKKDDKEKDTKTQKSDS